MTEFKYINRGRGMVLLHSGRQYFRKKIYKSGGHWWRCCNNLTEMKCTGSITINGSEILKENVHVSSCVMDAARNTWAENLEICKKKVVSTDEPVPKLFEEAANAYYNTGFNLVLEEPSFEDIKVGLYRKRNKALNVPKNAYSCNDDIAGIMIPQKFEDFLIGDYNSDGIRILLFATKRGIELMEKLQHFFGDGTFKCCISPFCQIYSIHGDCGSSSNTNNIAPLVYALMSSRDTKSYRLLFEIIKSRIKEWKPLKYTCDFESSTVKAIQEVFPKVKVKGCYYHFQECLIRKAKSLKIFNAKQNRRCVFLCRSLALLPRANIFEGWKYIEEQFNHHQHLQPFLKYFKRKWLRRNIIKTWSVFGERHRTNNYVEGWHRILSKNIKKYNRNLTDLIIAFKKDANSKRVPKKRRSSVKINEQMICEAQMSLLDGHITVGHFLEIVR